MNPENARIARLVAMAERLIVALEADITALESGKPKEMRSTDPEIQHLCAMYQREAASFNPAQAKSAPRELMARLTETTKKFRDLLMRHARILTRVRNASEGMIQAIAEEVDRRRAPLRTYAPAQVAKPRAATAMVFNSVV